MKAQTYFEEILTRSRKDSGLGEESFNQTVFDMYCVPIELYKKYKDNVLRLSLSYQKWVAPEDGSTILKAENQLSDKQIGERLGLDEDTVQRIRCMAEWDLPPEVWRNAAEFKRRSRLKRPLGCPTRTIRTEPS